MPELRPMIEADAEAVVGVMDAAFGDLSRRFGFPYASGPPQRGMARTVHCIRSTPAGAWVSVDGDTITGAALGIVREDLWGLSLLVVDPAAQSAGAGRALLHAALGPAEGTRGGLIMASEDQRALRAYHGAGFALRPCLDARGPVKRVPERPATVRDGRWPEDRDLCDAASRAVRGAAHGEDIEAMLAGGARLLVHEAGGFVTIRGGDVALLAAPEEPAARELLRAALAELADGPQAERGFIDAGQQWAFDEFLAAGLDLSPGGAIAVRGDVGPLRPYLPSGAYL